MSGMEGKERIIQEFVPGKQVTLAHVIASPDRDLYGKLGLIDAEGAIGIMTITPSEGAMIAADIRTGKKYFLKVLFCNNLEQIYVEKESKVQLFSPYIIRIYGGMLDEKNRRFITLVEYIEQ